MVNAMDNDGNNEQGEKGIKPSGDKKTNLRSFPTLSSLNETEKLEQDNPENSSKPKQECAEASPSEDPKVKAGETSDVSPKDEKEYKHEEQPMENVEEEEALYEAEQIKRSLEGPSAGSSPNDQTKDDEKGKKESSVLKSINQETKKAQENTSGLDQDDKGSQITNKEKEKVSDENESQSTHTEKQVDESSEQENKPEQKRESSLGKEELDSKIKEEKDKLKDNNGTEKGRNIDVSIEKQQYDNNEEQQPLVTRERKQHIVDVVQQASVSNEPQKWDNSEEQGSNDIEEKGSERKQKCDDNKEQQANNDIGKQTNDNKQQVDEGEGESIVERFKKVVRKARMVQSMRYPSFIVSEDVAENVEVKTDEGLGDGPLGNVVIDEGLGDEDMCSMDEISQVQARHKEYEDVCTNFYMERLGQSVSKDEVEQGVQSGPSVDEKVTLICCTPKEGCCDSEILIPTENAFNELVMTEDGEALVMVDDGEKLVMTEDGEPLVMVDDDEALMMGDDHNYTKVVTQQPVRLPSPSEILNELDSILEEQDKEDEEQDKEEYQEENEEEHWILHQQLGMGCTCETAVESMGCGMVRNGPIKTHRGTLSDVGGMDGVSGLTGVNEASGFSGLAQVKKQREQHGKSSEEGSSSSSSKNSGNSSSISIKKGKEEEDSNVVKKKIQGQEKKKVHKTSRNNIVEGPDEMIDAVLGDNVRIIRSTAMLLNVWPVDYGNSRQVARVMSMEIVDEENLLGCYYRINVKGEEGLPIPMLIERSTGDEIMRIIRKKKMNEEIGMKCPELKIPERIRKRAIVMEQGRVIYRAPGEGQVSTTGKNVVTGETTIMSTSSAMPTRSAMSTMPTRSAMPTMPTRSAMPTMPTKSAIKEPAANTESTRTKASYTPRSSRPSIKLPDVSHEPTSASDDNTQKGDPMSMKTEDPMLMKTPDNKRPMRPSTPAFYGGRKLSTDSYSSTSTLSTEESSSSKSPNEEMIRREIESEQGTLGSYEGKRRSSQSESTTSGSSEELVLFERGAVGGIIMSREEQEQGEQEEEQEEEAEGLKTPKNYGYFQRGFGRGQQKTQPKRPKSRLGYNKEGRMKMSPIETSKVRRRLEFLDEDDKESEEKLREKGEDKEFVPLEMDETLNEITTSDSDMSSMVRSTSSGGAGIMIGDFSDEDDENEYTKSINEEKSNSHKHEEEED
ncbi:hypothetical protein MACK_002165 [Theileria orientalis]|uniref:Uncharacterized protein n=1 Tax=Theileria orientalis TaxID=68886 RepID=A0A976QU33_THEOR|nr:hypothetical protein MACK_002165 [Theileria orientalis]